jgi:pimeloyl-ACP methyl ester carboxylesterase
MAYAHQGGVRVHYDVVGEGPALLLHHGFSSRGDTWRQFGYLEPLARRHRVILIDARGHGDSDKPHDPAAYALANRVADVLAVLDAAGVERAHFLGYSMGGWIGFGLAAQAPARLASLIVGGAHPYADASWRGFRAPGATEPARFLAAFATAIGEPIPEVVHPLVLQNDLVALAASAGDRPSQEPVLGHIQVPCLLYAGERDARHALIRRAAGAAGAAFVTLPAVGHVDGMARADLAVPEVERFLDRLRS